MAVSTGELDLEPFIKKYKKVDEMEKDKPDEVGTREISSQNTSIPSQIKEVKSSSEHGKSFIEVPSSITKSRPVPKSMSITQMLQMGKGKTNNGLFSLVNIYKFDIAHMTWSLIPQKIELNVEVEAFSSGGFRKAYKATSITQRFSDTTWVIKCYLPDALNTIQTVGQTVEEHTKKAIQTHLLAKNFAEMLEKEVSQQGITSFGETLKYNKVYLSKFEASGEITTNKECIKGDFKKYLNHTGINCGEQGDIAGKAECLAHYSYEKSERRMLLVDLQGSGNGLFDPEMVTVDFFDNGELLFCAGNLSITAIDTFISNHNVTDFASYWNWNNATPYE